MEVKKSLRGRQQLIPAIRSLRFGQQQLLPMCGVFTHGRETLGIVTFVPTVGLPFELSVGSGSDVFAKTDTKNQPSASSN